MFDQEAQRNHMIALVKMRMPFGKYEGRRICELPESYLVWFKSQGFPKGKLGELLETMYEIKLNGLEDMLTPIKRKFGTN